MIHAGILNPGGFPVLTTLALGFVLGLRHALDADHVAAVSTFVSEESSPLRSSLIGAFWGLGHTAALLVCGFAVAAFRLVITPHQARFFDFLVGCMLVFLGVKVLVRLTKGSRLHVHAHEHDGVKHTHLHIHVNDAEHAHQHHVLRLGGRPFIVGAVHGLAGTAAVMLLVVGAIPSLLLAVGTILIFGLGSIGGMMVMSLLLSLPMALAARRLLFLERMIRLAAGLFSLGLGLFLAWNIGFLQALP